MNKLKNRFFKFITSETDIGQRLDKWLTDKSELKEHIPTRSFTKSLFEKDLIKINNKISKSSAIIKNKDTIEIEIPITESIGLVPYDFKLDIIFEDNDLIVVNKPSGLVVHPAAGHEQDTLVNALINHTNQLSMKNELRPGIVHRIDKETSGLLVIAKNDQAHENLSNQFKNKTTHRIYYAVIDGKLKTKKSTISSYLTRHLVDRKRYASVKINNKIMAYFDPHFEKGKWAITHCELIKEASKLSYVKVQLETGRTHQIRVHLSEQAQPLVGDLTYGYSAKKYKELSLKRFYLHAAELGFNHPKTGDKMIFKSDWPKEDLNLIQSWGLR